MTSERKLIVQLGTLGHVSSASHLLRQLSARYDVWSIAETIPPWHADSVAGVTTIAETETETVRQALSDVMKIRPVHGIVTWHEQSLVPAAACAESLGLRSPGVEGARACRDKARTREKLTAAGLLQPQWRCCMTEVEALTFARTLGFPVVIKPRALVGSIGVSLVASEVQLKRKFREVAMIARRGFGEFKEGVLIEEYVEGPEISVDGAVVDGHYTPLCVAGKTLGFAPYFEELGHFVSSTDPLRSDPELLDTLRRSHAAVAFENGVTHTELKLSKRGMTVIEINARLGGYIHRLAELAWGLQIGLIAGQVAVGDPVDLTVHHGGRAASLTFRYPERNIKLKSVTLPEPVRSSDIEGYCIALAEPGAFVGVPPAKHNGHIGYGIAVGKDLAACTALSDALAQQIQFTAE